MKHTKGEWKASKNSCFYEVYCRSEDSPSLGINIFLQDGKIDKNLSKENEANAKLIASAPELLELIGEIDAWLSFNQHPSKEQISEMRKSIQQAIKKATT